jgi:hypothetical protein
VPRASNGGSIARKSDIQGQDSSYRTVGSRGLVSLRSSDGSNFTSLCESLVGLFFYSIANPSFGFESKCEIFQEAPPATSGRPCKRLEECARCDEFGLVSPPATRELKGA